MEVQLTEKKLDSTHRIGNPKSGNKRPRPIIVKFACHNIRRKVFVNKRRLKNTGITENLTKQIMEFLKRAKNEFGFNVWTVDGRICYCNEVAKTRYILTNFCGFLCYEKHKIESFFYFWVCLGN